MDGAWTADWGSGAVNYLSPGTYEIRNGILFKLPKDKHTMQPNNTAPVGDVNSTARGSGARFNKNKTPFRYIPLFLLDGAARVFQQATTRAQNPYPMWNWANGMAWSIPYECALRHLDKFYRGEEIDEDSGEDHLDHVICNLLMLKHYRTAYPEGDDRPVEFRASDEPLTQFDFYTGEKHLCFCGRQICAACNPE